MITALLLAQLTLPSPLPPLLELTRRFSGSKVPPKCQKERIGNLAPFSPASMVCAWTWAGPRSTSEATLLALVGGPGEPTMIQWQIPGLDSAAAHRLADSVGAELRTGGFTPRKCVEGDVPAGRALSTQWSKESLVLFLSHYVPPPGKPGQFTAIGTDVPEAIPSFLCDGPAKPDTTSLGPLRWVPMGFLLAPEVQVFMCSASQRPTAKSPFTVLELSGPGGFVTEERIRRGGTIPVPRRFRLMIDSAGAPREFAILGLEYAEDGRVLRSGYKLTYGKEITGYKVSAHDTLPEELDASLPRVPLNRQQLEAVKAIAQKVQASRCTPPKAPPKP